MHLMLSSLPDWSQDEDVKYLLLANVVMCWCADTDALVPDGEHAKPSQA